MRRHLWGFSIVILIGLPCLGADNATAPSRSERHKKLQVSDAKRLVDQLLKSGKQVDALALTNVKDKRSLDRMTVTANRADMQTGLTAMSLACHIFQFEKGRWPKDLNDLMTTDLLGVPIDPFGNGKQTLGYVLIDKGLPGGSPRPLVYSKV